MAASGGGEPARQPRKHKDGGVILSSWPEAWLLASLARSTARSGNNARRPEKEPLKVNPTPFGKEGTEIWKIYERYILSSWGCVGVGRL
ncbi:hypothetical protein H8959_012387 [Pygathrix nigripes]